MPLLPWGGPGPAKKYPPAMRFQRDRGAATTRRSLPMSEVSMEILGQDWSGNSLWVALRDDDGFEDEYEVHEFDLELMQRDINRGYKARLFGHRLDEPMVRTLANAILAPQRFWPPVICREGGCGAEASVRIKGEPYCHGHAMSFTAREEGQ